MGEEQGDEVASEVRRLIRRHGPAGIADRDLPDDRALAEGGLGFDSVRLVEFLFACEERFGVRIPPSLVEGLTLTVGRIVGWVRTTRRRP